jgi:hypothetical protein|tara:strand:- start:3748 stop:3972 length:225 start_codon:yes stop_codon:yes gene_type:complete
MRKQLYDMLWTEAIADRKKALLSLDLLSDHAAGIGDHSTDDYWKNCKQSLELLVDADDKLECLRKYFKEEHDEG